MPSLPLWVMIATTGRVTSVNRSSDPVRPDDWNTVDHRRGQGGRQHQRRDDRVQQDRLPEEQELAVARGIVVGPTFSSRHGHGATPGRLPPERRGVRVHGRTAHRRPTRVGTTLRYTSA
jgi:hypothetical protein